MATTAPADWPRYAREQLAHAGHRTSAPRGAVIDALHELGCGVTASEIDRHLRDKGARAGLASIYRHLELLRRHQLVRRIDIGEGRVRYEALPADGEHHHHLVCESCGAVIAFEDHALERAITKLSGRVEFDVSEHDVTLRGACLACRR